MVEPDAKASPVNGASGGASKPPRPPNPVWRMMGLPNFRFKLPSRNWMIFLSITGSWTAAVMYDRRQKKRIQRKWAKVVEHIAQEPIETQQLPRKLTVFVSAPPADGLVPARDHFHEYVKPILVAAALDWDAVEGRREGDVRAGLAERIRRLRKKRGEPSEEPIEVDLQEILEDARSRSGVKDWDGPQGDIIIGRHTWKEYVRGLHEGWLGPLDPPVPVAADTVAASIAPRTDTAPDSTPSNPPTTDDASPTAAPEAPKVEEGEKAKEGENKPKKKKQPPPFNTTTDYENALLSPNCPRALGPSAVIPFPHLLGFLNFPIRMYRFLNKRQVADDIGRQTAAAVIGAYQPFEGPGESSISSATGDGDYQGSGWEQTQLLLHEEPDWHKTIRERKEDDDKEHTWTNDMILDPRIAERMRKFVLEPEDEERANRIASDKSDSWFKSLWPKAEEKKKPMWEGLNDDD